MSKLFQPWEILTTGRVIDVFQNHFLKSVIHASVGKSLTKSIDHHQHVQKRREALLAAIGVLKAVREKGIKDNPNDRDLIVESANKALEIASEKVGVIASNDEQETIDLVQAACLAAKIDIIVKQESKMSDPIIDVRSADTEREFCEEIDTRVAEFNEIADQEILGEPQPVGELTDIESITAATINVAQSFQENLKKTTFPKKLEALKEAFGKIADIGMDAVCAVKLKGTEASQDTVMQAIKRLTHVLDIMNDDASDFAPELVRSDAIYNDEWKSLLKHRNEVSDQLRDQLSTLDKRLLSMTPV